MTEKQLVPVATEVWPSYIKFGDGIIENLPAYLDELGMNRPLIVSDAGVKSTGILGRVTEILDRVGKSYSVFDEIEPNPSDKTVYRVRDAYAGSSCDSIIGIGGGSPLDAARIVRVLANHPGEISNYYAVRGGGSRITANLPPMITIPTTSGTGSEVSKGAIVTDTETRKKYAVGSRFLLPSLALLDPELTWSMPPRLTALTGMDALTHNIEAAISPVDDQEPAEALALLGIELVSKYLRRAVTTGSDREARKKMAMASMLGAISFNSKGLGSAHALAHMITPASGIPHGLACAVMLPYIMEYNLEFATERLARVAAAMGANRDGRSTKELAEAGIAMVRDLAKDVDLPTTLSESGKITKQACQTIAQNAMGDHTNATNPRKPTVADYEALLEAAF
jgi:4-hydroxybutyrate dehydrogenase